MDLSEYKPSFDRYLGVKNEPNTHEVFLFKRAKKYIEKITWIPGIRMIAIVNSLSMYATHKNSDIDLFIITAKNRMWLVRTLITMIFWMHGVWRHKKEIAGNFCLSFWMEEEAIDIKKIALKNDVYLYFWMYYMKPILLDNTLWEEFIKINTNYQFSHDALTHLKFSKGNLKTTFISRGILSGMNNFIRYFGEKKSRKSWKKKGSPEGVIIGSHMLKFHDMDRRKEILEKIMNMQ